jgi:hypothetical protein
MAPGCSECWNAERRIDELRQSETADPERVGIERALSFLSGVVDRDPASVAFTVAEADAPNAEREAL